MTRFSLRRALGTIRLVERRARGLEPGDDALSRLRLDSFAAAPRRWLKNTLAKLAVVFVLAALAACVFAGGNALMRAMGMGH